MKKNNSRKILIVILIAFLLSCMSIELFAVDSVIIGPNSNTTPNLNNTTIINTNNTTTTNTTANTPIATTTVTLNKSSETIAVGNTSTLIATVSTGEGVVWSSSNTSVATVSNNGVVKGISSGTAIITATANGKTAICNITVNENSSIPSTTSRYNTTNTNSSLPKTGESDIYIVIALLGVCIISTIYAYKKIRDYNV